MKTKLESIACMIIRQATSCGEFAGVLSKVMDWLEKDPDAQWSRSYVSEDSIAKAYLLSELFVAELDGELIGAVALQQYDAVYWPEDVENESLYLHKLAVIDEYRGVGVADALIEFSKVEVLRQGRAKLRLDCQTYRKNLVKYYLNRGFDIVFEREAHHGMATLFEMKLPALK